MDQTELKQRFYQVLHDLAHELNEGEADRLYREAEAESIVTFMQLGRPQEEVHLAILENKLREIRDRAGQ